ncbi:MAG: hypothetical protein ABIR70_22630 [Bryobacteraceae bacterium]
MRQTLLFLTISGAVFAQSMLESSAVIAGSTVGGASGKAISTGIDKTFKKTGSILEGAAKTGEKKGKGSPSPAVVSVTPVLRVSPGVPKAELNNVPPPPPPTKRAAAPKPSRTRAVSVPMVMASVIPRYEPAFLVNVDLAGISRGMDRDSVLSLGIPSARIIMDEDGKIVEIYQYRNQTFHSGTVRLRDGLVWAVETRP